MSETEGKGGSKSVHPETGRSRSVVEGPSVVGPLQPANGLGPGMVNDPWESDKSPDAPFSILSEWRLDKMAAELQAPEWSTRKLDVLLLIAEVRYRRREACKALSTPPFNHTRADGPFNPCDECLPSMSTEGLVRLVESLRDDVDGLDEENARLRKEDAAMLHAVNVKERERRAHRDAMQAWADSYALVGSVAEREEALWNTCTQKFAMRVPLLSSDERNLRLVARAFDERHPNCTKGWKNGVCWIVKTHASDCPHSLEHQPPDAARERGKLW